MDAACFQHDSAYAKYKALKIATDPRFNGYQKGLSSMVYKSFNERTKGSGINLQANSLNNEILAEERHKPIIKNFKEEKYILVLKIMFGVLI